MRLLIDSYFKEAEAASMQAKLDYCSKTVAMIDPQKECCFYSREA